MDGLADWLKEKLKPTRILIIDDEDTLRDLYRRLMVQYFCEIKDVPTGADALELISREDFDLVLLDYMLPGEDGTEIFRQIRKLRPAISVVIISGYIDNDMVNKLAKVGFSALIPKSMNSVSWVDDLMRTFRVVKIEG
jgi:CheY-like chemotaxis protein